MEYQEALEFIKSHYNQSWNNLLWLFGIGFAAIGIVMPIVIQLIQSKNNEKQNEDLQKVIKIQFESKMDELKNTFEKKWIDLVERADKIEKNLLFLQGNILVTQGRISSKTERENITETLFYYLSAISSYLRSDRTGNIKGTQKTIIEIINIYENNLKIPSIFNEIDLQETYDMTLSLLEKNNDDGKYSKLICVLKERISFTN